LFLYLTVLLKRESNPENGLVSMSTSGTLYTLGASAVARIESQRGILERIELAAERQASIGRVDADPCRVGEHDRSAGHHLAEHPVGTEERRLQLEDCLDAGPEILGAAESEVIVGDNTVVIRHGGTAIRSAHPSNAAADGAGQGYVRLGMCKIRRYEERCCEVHFRFHSLSKPCIFEMFVLHADGHVSIRGSADVAACVSRPCHALAVLDTGGAKRDS
jgi:hypothetical protein